MNPPLARLVYTLAVIGLIYLNRDKSVRTSKALWIPVVWLWILGSRAVSIWLGGGWAAPSADALMEGSPMDALVFQVLLVSGLVVLAQRGQRCLAVMKGHWPIICYFSYCLMSVVWSDYPDVSLKRWIKATGDVVMALVVLTDAQPAAALRRLYSRVGFILSPASVVLIKYYPYLGRGYDQWTGQQFTMGVTTDKNILGVTTYVLAVGTLWQILRLLKNSDLPGRLRQLVAQCGLLGFQIWILFTANSVTSLTCFTLAAFLMLATSLPRFTARPAAVHQFVLGLIIIGGLMKMTGADTAVVRAMGRNPDLTGRASDIWPLLFRMAPNPVLGAGFETFWLGPRLRRVWAAFPNLYVSEAHNGYLELYLNLGAIGLSLVLLTLVHGYRQAVAVFRSDSASGGLVLAYVMSVMMYGYTEAGFRMLSFAWSFLILSIIGARYISEGSRSGAQASGAPRESMWWSSTIVEAAPNLVTR